MARGITFEAGGKSYTLRFDINALCDVESMLGTSLPQLSLANAGMSTIRVFLWAGLRQSNRGLTLETAGLVMQALIDQGKTWDEIGQLINDALVAAGLATVEGEDDSEGEDGDSGNA